MQQLYKGDYYPVADWNDVNLFLSCPSFELVFLNAIVVHIAKPLKEVWQWVSQMIAQRWASPDIVGRIERSIKTQFNFVPATSTSEITFQLLARDRLFFHFCSSFYRNHKQTMLIDLPWNTILLPLKISKLYANSGVDTVGKMSILYLYNGIPTPSRNHSTM